VVGGGVEYGDAAGPDAGSTGAPAVAAGAGACSAQNTVPYASRRHCSQTGLPQERQYAVAGTSG